MIDVSVQTDTDISWPPAITLVYLLPYLPSWLPVTATLRVCPSTTSSSGYQVGCSFASTETLVETGKMKDSSHETTLKRIIFGQMEKAKGQGDSGGVGVGPEEDRSKAMMEEILAISGDLKMVMKWINAKVETAADAIVSLYRR